LAAIGKNLDFFVRHDGREGEAAIIPLLTGLARKIERAKAFTSDFADRDLNLDRNRNPDLDPDLFPLFPVKSALGYRSQPLPFRVTRSIESRWMRWWQGDMISC
jgi:hypothetical protein